MKLKVLVGHAAMAMVISLWAGGHGARINGPVLRRLQRRSARLEHLTPGWTVSSGTIDVVGPGDGFGLTCASGRCVDTDGSTGDAGIISNSFHSRAGQLYARFRLVWQSAGRLRHE